LLLNFGLFILLALELCLLNHGPLWAQPISREEYVHRVREGIELLNRGEEGLTSHEETWLASRLPRGLEIQEPDGDLISVDQTDLLRWTDDARASSEGRSHLIAYLQALEEQISSPIPRTMPPGMSWKHCEGVLDEVYRDPQFRYLREWTPPFWAAFFDKVLRAIGRWLRAVLPSMSATHWKWVQAVAYGIVLLSGAALLWWIFRLVRPGDSKRAPSPPVPIVSPSEPDLDWTRWRRRARQKAQKGAFREAIRCLFVSILMEGQHRGWWLYQPEATNGEHLERMQAPNRRRDAFRQLMTQYEKAWYGMRHAGKEQFADCESLVRRMEEMA
jgi:hypothetical protein